MSGIVFGVFVSSVLGSVHCAGMCGPLVASYAGLPGTALAWPRRAVAHGAYSLGRLAAYVVLGAMAGALGSAIDRAGAWAGVSRIAAIASGTLIALWGLHAFLAARGVGVPRLSAPGPWRRGLGFMLRAVARQPAWLRAIVLGLGSALLPCGWLYAFVATAGGTGSALAGALVMAVFWAGTLPVMLAVGEAIRAVSGPLRRHVPAVCAVVVMVLGLLTILGRAPVGPRAAAAGAAPPECHGTR
jgi:sulfite exporter TauE/SafE